MWRSGKGGTCDEDNKKDKIGVVIIWLFYLVKH
nr:MAG TPA_asm: hypothetical protein [Caudoviricetes sp.]